MLTKILDFCNFLSKILDASKFLIRKKLIALVKFCIKNLGASEYFNALHK